MKDFNIANYLRENSLGSHAILGAYVDLHALKEEEVGNNKPVDEVPYVGDEEKLDGFGDTFDQVDPVEEDFSYDDDRDDVNPFPSLNRGGYSDEQDKFDRMMGLSHEYIGKVSPVVKKTIDALRADGFDDQDIVDFLATDLSNLEEEVSVSSSGVEMEEASKDEFSNVVNTLNGIAKKVKPTGAKLSFDDDSFSDGIIVQVVTKDGDSKLQKAVHAEVKKLIQKANSGFKVSRIEQDSPGRISFSIDKVNLESIEEAADFTKFVKVGNVYDNYHDATGGFRMKLKVTAVDPMNQTITAVDEKGTERTYSAYQFTNDYRAEDPNPIDSKWTDPGYKNRD